LRASNPDPEFESLLDYLKRNRGFDFTGYKRPSLMRRIRLQMGAANLDNYEDYTGLLEADPDEIKRLLNTILINVTGFFRDLSAWEYLQQQVIPQIVEAKSSVAPIRTWSAGCASGEEAYTLAIVLAEVLGIDAFAQRVKIHATDLDEEALVTARQGAYTPQKIHGVPPVLLAKYFDRVADRYVLNKTLRRAIIFGRHDLTQDVPISHLDLLVCRNTLMYLNTEMQLGVLSRFHFALNEGGFLFLGKAEMLLARTRLFTPVDVKRRVFVRAPNGAERSRPLFFVSMPEDPSADSDPMHFSQIAFQTSPVAQIVVSRAGALALANERASALFRLTPRDLGQPLQDLEISYRPAELRSAIEQVYEKQSSVTLKEVTWSRDDGDSNVYRVQVTPLPNSSTAFAGVCISFLDITEAKRLQAELEASNVELTNAYEEAQASAEELETTNEELQSSAEELETTNEELQSANEEMETMNEELQSANEELETTNEVLRQRTQELTQVSQFLEAILSSLQGGVIVVDQGMQVHAWNPQSAELWGLRTDEVVGKNLATLEFGLAMERIYPLLRACLTGASPLEEITLDAFNRRGKAIVCKVTCTPVKDGNNKVIGAMLLTIALS
jgi:two-component system CheB/CheR fusion protein